MPIFEDKDQKRIRLSDERIAHLESVHPEMRHQHEAIALTLKTPDMIVRSNTDATVALYYRFFETTPVTQKHLCVVVKAKQDDPFVITVYFTDSVKKGEILWQKKM